MFQSKYFRRPDINTKLNIRQVKSGDLDSCFRVETACFSASEAASKEKIKKRINIFPQGFIVAEKDGMIVGHVNSAAIHKDDISDEELKSMIGHEKNGKNMVVFSVAVLPEFQGQGVSMPMMQGFIESSKKMNKEKILLLCKKDMIPYYEKFGFMDHGPSKSTHGGFEWHEMALSLM